MENLQERVVTGPVDRISKLPDSILCHTLSFLPTKVAAATSVLSRRWRFLWTRVPALSFHFLGYLGNGEDEEEDDENEELKEVEAMKFVQIVEKALRQNDVERLEKFQLHWWDKVKVVFVKRWVRYAISRNVRVLNLDLCSYDSFCVDDARRLPLPGTLFTSGTLENFRLAGSGFFKIEIPSVICLPKLEVFVLVSVCYGSDACLNNLIAACPVLHSLKIVKMDDGNFPYLQISSPSLRYVDISYHDYEGRNEVGGKIEIDAPALESLFLEDHISQEFIVKRPRAVKEVNLDLEIYQDDDEELYIDQCNLLVETIQTLDRVKILELTGSTIAALSDATTPLAASFDRLTKLKVECHCCNWSSLNAVLGCCFRLQVLDILVCGGDCEQAHKECWRDPEEVPIWLSWSLKEVSLRYYSGLSQIGILKMIRYILLHGAMMKTLEIWFSPFDSDSSSPIFEKISMFPRASPTCQIGSH